MTHTCKTCGTKFVWAKTIGLKNIPIEQRPAADGAYGLVEGLAFRAGKDYKGATYHTHLGRCKGPFS